MGIETKNNTNELIRIYLAQTPLQINQNRLDFTRMELFDNIATGEGSNTLQLTSTVTNGPASLVVYPNGTPSGSVTYSGLFAMATDYEASKTNYDVFGHEVIYNG